MLLAAHWLSFSFLLRLIFALRLGGGLGAVGDKVAIGMLHHTSLATSRQWDGPATVAGRYKV